jgi:hypothetical protein
MWITTQDGSVADQDGRIVCFSRQGFISEIAEGDGCFLCGARRDAALLGEEQVLPGWLLGRYALIDRMVNLPGGVQVPYDAYTVPCCARCQALLAERIETPMSELVLSGAPAVGALMFAWLTLVYLKIHLRERRFRADAPSPDTRGYETLHHAHSVVRAMCTGITIDAEALGSLVALPIRPQHAAGGFDYFDVPLAHTVLVRIDNTAMLAVLDDSGAAAGLFWNQLEKITGPLSELQLREIAVEFAYLNSHLKARPTFFTSYDLANESARLTARRPPLELVALDRRMRGELLLNAAQRLLPPTRAGADLAAAIRSGDFTFLFDSSGAFITQGAPAPADVPGGPEVR